MKLIYWGRDMRQYVVDAFTDKIFSGNPAAICILDTWLNDELMLNIAKENNLSETAFAVKGTDSYRLRWFTPGGEIDLCGHATLACAYVIMNEYEKDKQRIKFLTQSGILEVQKNGELFEMDFPAYSLKPVQITKEISEAIGKEPIEAYIGRDLLCVFDNEETIKNLNPQMDLVKNLGGLLLHVTAQSENTDIVSRSFAPKLNVQEDPVCGSGHCHIIPYWSKKLNKDSITAYQASSRGGKLYCHMKDDRVILSGKAVIYSVADIHIPL